MKKFLTENFRITIGENLSKVTLAILAFIFLYASTNLGPHPKEAETKDIPAVPSKHAEYTPLKIPYNAAWEAKYKHNSPKIAKTDKNPSEKLINKSVHNAYYN